MAERRRRVGIVGAGPAGIMAALEAARLGAEVLLFDTNQVVGRKLLVTGNGRCNISNRAAAADRYVCADPDFLVTAFALYGHQRTIACLEELCIPTYATPDGWCYPLSNSAAAVVDALAAALDLSGVELHLQTKISDVTLVGGEVALFAGGPSRTYAVDRVVMASGGKAYPSLGSKGTMFPVLERLGHTVVPIYPALVPLVADMRRFHRLQGVRLDAGLALYEGDRLLGRAVGNVMFTQNGLSGPAAMDLSYLVSTRPGAHLRIVVDLIALHHNELVDLIARVRSTPVPLRVVLGAFLPAKVPPVELSWAGYPPDVRLSDVSQSDLKRLVTLSRGVEIQVRGTRGFQFAQLSSGGVPVNEVEPRTMASRVVPGLHLAGEVLDVVGPCGGYNLQFALTSGALAGAGAAVG